MQKKVRVLTLCGAAAASAAMFWSCSGVGASTESFKRSDYFTRGIGQYPGNRRMLPFRKDINQSVYMGLGLPQLSERGIVLLLQKIALSQSFYPRTYLLSPLHMIPHS